MALAVQYTETFELTFKTLVEFTFKRNEQVNYHR
jgi:hypothetical protein